MNTLDTFISENFVLWILCHPKLCLLKALSLGHIVQWLTCPFYILSSEYFVIWNLCHIDLMGNFSSGYFVLWCFVIQNFFILRLYPLDNSFEHFVLYTIWSIDVFVLYTLFWTKNWDLTHCVIAHRPCRPLKDSSIASTWSKPKGKSKAIYCSKKGDMEVKIE